MEEADSVLITVALCTWNRSQLLDLTLGEMYHLTIPAGVSWELIVVDNGSTDDTEVILSKHRDGLPLRRVLEARQGLSHARNRAIEEAAGELIVFTDDDVLVDPGWLAAYHEAQGVWPEAFFFGGVIEPLFTVAAPAWVLRNLDALEGPFAIRRLGDTVRKLGDDEAPFGANMGFRSSAIKSLTFDPQLGRIGNNLLSGEDSEMIDRLKSRGAIGVWVGTARVRHLVPASRLTLDFIRNWYEWGGRTNARIDALGQSRPAKLWGAPRWTWKRLWMARLCLLTCGRYRGRRWIWAVKEAAKARGYILETRGSLRHV